MEETAGLPLAIGDNTEERPVPTAGKDSIKLPPVANLSADR